jgi:hypothetical protein
MNHYVVYAPKIVLLFSADDQESRADVNQARVSFDLNIPGVRLFLAVEQQVTIAGFKKSFQLVRTCETSQLFLCQSCSCHSIQPFLEIQKENESIASFRQILYSSRSYGRAKVTTWEVYGWELSSAFS